MAIVLKKRGPDHLAVAHSYNQFGTVHLGKGEYDKALGFYRKALAIDIKLWGPNDLSMAESYHNMGAVYSNMGEYDKALE